MSTLPVISILYTGYLRSAGTNSTLRNELLGHDSSLTDVWQMEKQQLRERGTKSVVLGVLDGSESLDGETTDDGKLRKILSKLDEPVNIQSCQRLERAVPGGT
ncbi:hypothetical protein E2C01_040898 [Portunus trituberculatus]|uniref:Uncharacterized protein n=1 Tax=Portunus trituberculatus TaxID=210409 RepID=A0A5B7FKZ9_PORTR|nr:hypothetical protein [Portunus trituberculatus]